MQPVRKIDPRTVEIKPLKPEELARAVAVKRALKYADVSQSMRGMWHKSKYYQLTPDDCEYIARLAEKMKLKHGF